MGQRLQAFIYCPNPVNGLKDRYKSLKKYNGDKQELEQLRLKIQQYTLAFGSKHHCIIAYHHQWLYGRSSLIAAGNIIEFNQNCEKNSNPFKTQTEITGEEYLTLLTNLLSIFKSKLAKTIGRYGYEQFRLLNFESPNTQQCCDTYDNNDGIFVVDCINDSYCFANVGNSDSTISQMPVLEPFDADRYVRLYYPNEISDSTTAYIPETNPEQEIYFNNNRRLNRLFTKPFKSYRVMTKNELKKLFPASFENTK
jgi:hypothetical protein